MSYLTWCILLLAACALATAGWLRRRTGARTHGRKPGGGFAWALLFLSSGRMPPPPPQSQIEAETNERKNSGTGRDRNS